MAILFALIHPDVDLVGLTSIFGNVTIDVATRNALVLAEMTGSPVPVARGADVRQSYRSRKKLPGKFMDMRVSETLPPKQPKNNPVDCSAAEFICRQVNEKPGEITLCPVGPLTNLALGS